MHFVPTCCRLARLPHLLICTLLLLQLLIPASLWAIGHPYVVKEINPSGHAIDPSLVNPFATLGNAIIFAASDGTTGTELWKSDGTSGGTVMLKDINPGSGNSTPASLTTLNGKVVFRATDPVNGNELWVTDGTPGGTQLLADIYPGTSNSTPQKFAVVGNALYLVATTASGSKLWKTDGTPAGTMPASEFTPGYYTAIDSLTASDNRLLAVTYLTGATQTWDLWSVDPLAGTSGRVTTFLSQPKNITPCGGKTFFSLNAGGYGEELWLTDGTDSGTVLVKEINTSGSSSPGNLVCLGSILYFRAIEPATGGELWKSDGSLDGTVMVQDIYPGAVGSYPSELKIFNNKLLFQANGTGTGSELWLSDGTGAGTVLVKDINSGSSYSSPNDLAVAGNRAVFAANDGVHGEEVWVSDGTAENTFLLADLNPGSGYASPGNFTVVGNTLFFSAYDKSVHYKLMTAALTPSPLTLISSPLPDSSVSAMFVVVTGEAHSDTGSPVALIEVSTDNGISWSPASGTTSWSYLWVPTGDAVYNLLARATDLMGTVETPGQPVTITNDRTPPSGWLKINNDDAATTTTLVTLSIHAVALDPGVTCTFFTYPYICGTVSIRFSNDGTGWSAWETAHTVKNWTLLAGDGGKTVYAQLKDRAGNITDISDTITLDTSQVPSSTITSPATGFATNGSSVFVSGTAATGPGGGTVTLVEVSADGGSTWQTAAGTTSWSINLSLPIAGSYNIKSRARTSTLIEAPANGITVTVDRTPPSGTLALYYGVWTLNATDGGTCILVYPFICGSLEMSLNGFTWQPATTQPGTGGPLWLRDKAGNVSQIAGGSYTNSNGGPIQMSSATGVYFSWVQHAYNAALSGDLIKLSNGLAENLTLSRNINLTLRGGYGSGFATVTGTTPVTGDLKLQAGSASIENIDLSGTMTVEGGDATVSGISVR
jgi:ELWxxDGT repeat protein